ncbi:MAG TPA: SDR family oxidoreductase [Candidatus Peribacteraceae bacterium]|nr:SDR family oxidoreductase [Candidatus Peribacteraceae bacterium]
MSDLLQGKNCLVTGASRGIGYAIARRLAARGCNLYLTSRDEKALRKATADIKKEAKGSIASGAYDLTDIPAVKAMVEEATRTLGHIDVLINNAGILIVAPLTETTPEDFGRTMHLNVRAPFLLIKMLVPGMVERGWGRIVNIGSTSSYSGYADTAAYCASKHALLGLSRSAQAELQPKGVRVFCVSPGSVKTDMGKQVKNQDFDTFLEPDAIAERVILLLQNEGDESEVIMKRKQ